MPSSLPPCGLPSDRKYVCNYSQLCFPPFHTAVAGPVLNPPRGFLSPASLYLREHPRQGRVAEGPSKPTSTWSVTSLLRRRSQAPHPADRQGQGHGSQTFHGLAPRTPSGTISLTPPSEAPSRCSCEPPKHLCVLHLCSHSGYNGLPRQCFLYPFWNS